jgi:hypothetical protein
MNRRDFIKTTSAAAAAVSIADNLNIRSLETAEQQSWFERPMRWAQLTLVENDPGRFDPDFWLGYFKKVHADGATLSAGGVVAYYPTDIPLHHRSNWLGDSDPFGYLVNGCRGMNMSVIARTDPHATWQNVYDTHPDWIAVTAEGEKRRHWANPELWVTCALGPYNFEFMTTVHKEIMERYEPDGIFSNRWAGHGICYCSHCKENFRKYSGMELPLKAENSDPVYMKYLEWSTGRLKELWILWDDIIRKTRPVSRFIPNGFPDKVITGQLSDIVFTDHQSRSGFNMPWLNGKVAKELRSSIGMKPLGGIFSVGIADQNRWSDSVQSEAETRIWVAEGTANGMRPWFTKFSGVLYDKRWLKTVDKIYNEHYRVEKYLRNVSPMARIGMVFSEQPEVSGKEPWRQRYEDHSSGMYHALVESRIPFEMVNDRLLEYDRIKQYKLLILPSIVSLSDYQCNCLRDFAGKGGSIIATFETSLYDETGKRRQDFGLSDLFGVSFDNKIEGPMKNSYLKLKKDPVTGKYHQVLNELEDAYRIINTIYKVNVRPNRDFPSPLTLIPTYPDLPMEHVYPRNEDTDIRELYLSETGKSRIAYFPGDIDRSFWQILCIDHGRLLRNTFLWALNEEPQVVVKGPGVVDVTCWKQALSLTVHLVNLTNPMLMKGPYRELIPVNAEVSINLTDGIKPKAVKLLIAGTDQKVVQQGNKLLVTVPAIYDHEIIGIDL